MSSDSVKDRLAVLLALQILDLVQNAAPNQIEAECALKAALAMLPDLELRKKPTSV